MESSTVINAIETLKNLIEQDFHPDNIAIFEKIKSDLAIESPIPLRNKIVVLVYEQIDEPVYCAEYDRYSQTPPYVSDDVKTLLQFYEEKLFEITPAKTKEDLQKQKLLKAKNNNIDFLEKLGEMIVGDAPYFPYRSSSIITHFFEESGYPHLKHDGSTRRLWVRDQLEKLSIDDLYNILKCLLKPKYFQYYNPNKEVDRNKAKELVKQLLDSSCKMEECEDIDEIFDIDVNASLLFQKDIHTNDDILNKDIEDARKFYIKGDLQTALEKIWDAFERIKSLYGIDKKQSVSDIVATLSDEIQTQTSSVMCSKKEDLFFNQELQTLTDIGNHYKIRHSEADKKKILNTNTQEYLFFRVLNIVALICSRMPKISGKI